MSPPHSPAPGPHRPGGSEFPPLSQAAPSGLLAVGGDLAPGRLLGAYRRGIFPWYEQRPVRWYAPDPRMVLPAGALQVSRRLKRTLRQGRFQYRLDTCFTRVMQLCRTACGRARAGSWINDDMLGAYTALHTLGFAHSCEAWRGDALVGGVYGVALGRVFFAESMFHMERDASKAALTALVRQLERWGFILVDCQFYTEHLAALGAREISRSAFTRVLAQGVAGPQRAGPWRFDEDFFDGAFFE